MELYDLTAEQAFIGACLIDYNEVAKQGAPALEPEDFYATFHQDLYRTILDCSINSNVNIVSVSCLMKANYPQKEYSYGLLTTFMETCHLTSEAEYYAKIIFDYSQKRKLKLSLDTISYGIDKGEYETSEAFESTLEQVFSLYGRSSTVEKKEFTATDLIADLEEQALEAYKLGKGIGREEVLKTGFSFFDNIYGIKRGYLVYVGGRPSMGKTTLTLQFAINMAINGYTVVYFSFEVPNADLQKKIVCTITDTNYEEFDNDRIRTKALDAIKDAKEKMNGKNLHIIDRACTIAEMRMYIKHIEAKTKKKVDAVFIDRMEFINDKQLNKESENDYVTRKSKGLANMAKDFNVSVVCLIQLNRESVKRKTKTKAVPRPSLVDLRGSGSTEQDAKMVLFVHRECMITGVEDKDGELIIAKNMCGLLGNVNLVFEKYIPKFYICQKEEVSSVPESSYDYSFANDVYSGEADCSFDDDEEREPPPERGYGYSNN